MSKRLEVLEKMTASGKADSFAWYGLALEYRSLGRKEDAIQAFHTLKDKDPSYVPMYLMAGQISNELGRQDDARTWVSSGIAEARKKRDTHALGELESLLAELSR